MSDPSRAERRRCTTQMLRKEPLAGPVCTLPSRQGCGDASLAWPSLGRSPAVPRGVGCLGRLRSALWGTGDVLQPTSSDAWGQGTAT